MTVLHMKGREAPKNKRSAMETLIFSRDEVMTWKIPPFQRPIRLNDKVMNLAESMKADGGIIPGVLTLGRLGTDKTIYLVDGQHRMEAFKISEQKECLADARMCQYSSMAEMAEDFVELNGKLVNMRPDDILRGLEESLPQLRRIRASCEFVTYGQINRYTTSSALIGMSQLLRCWYMSHAEAPARHSPAATVLAQSLEPSEADKLILFLQTARAAWGNDPENYRLWGSLNLTLVMWMWRRLVLDKTRGVKKAVVLSVDDFRKCLMSVAASGDYVEWLVGRQMGERDRAPGYARLKAIFVKRLSTEGGERGKVMFPQPAWAAR
jgi:ParB/Sulfiredoxin domain